MTGAISVSYTHLDVYKRQYHDIVEATNAHSYRVYDGEEHWM